MYLSKDILKDKVGNFRKTNKLERWTLRKLDDISQIMEFWNSSLEMDLNY